MTGMMSGSSVSPHDYGALLDRWKALSAQGELRLDTLCEVDGDPVFHLENERAVRGENGGLYLSTGVHGDECAPVWALLEWAASDPAVLHDRPVTLFPCLNPAGFRANTRFDGFGTDLNRSFTDRSHPVIGAWQESMSGRRYDLALNLHEDYDANGIYLYELTRRESVGHTLLSACEGILPRETSAQIDGSEFDRGLLVRSGDIERVVEEQLGGGYPEAILLFLRHAESSFTFETPSERDLSLRIAAHRAFLDAVSLL
jgi:protein MpaA